ncbi:MAG: ribosome maturation factor RimM [Amoebophilaceae bacterium]|jgi:16S rRNA processing protein RimM|nr:ribosome maturation factor RimM [Amoebophilaceae bacterium]
MDTEAYAILGVVRRRQGLKGNVVAWFNHDVTHPDNLSMLFIQINHTLVPYRVERLSCQYRKAIIKLQGVDDPASANYLQGRSMFVLREDLPQLFPQVAHLDRLLGYHVADVREGDLGVVRAIYAPSQQRLLAIDYCGRELLVPYHEAIVIYVNHEQKTITLQLPDGFIEAVY